MVFHEVGTEQRVLTIQEYLLTEFDCIMMEAVTLLVDYGCYGY